jgi:hypothetical protein
MRVVLGLSLVGLVMASSSPAAAPRRPPAPSAADRALHALARDVAALMRELPPETPRTPDSLTPTRREAELDRAAHRQFGVFVEAWLREHGPTGSTEEIARALAADIERGGVGRVPEGTGGDDVTIAAYPAMTASLKLTRPEGDPGLLAVSWSTPLTFLDDASLYVFATDGGRVERVFEWSAKQAEWPDFNEEYGRTRDNEPFDFDDTDVLNDLAFRVTPRDARGDFYVATAWSEPSPNSSWGAVSWAIFARGDGPVSPRLLERGTDGAFNCYADDCYTLALDGDRVSVAYTGVAGMLAVCAGYNATGLERTWLLAAGGAEQLGPPVDDPFGFVSIWLRAPWEEAHRWSSDNESIRRWHNRLDDVACDLDRTGEWVDTCDGPPSRELLELTGNGTSRKVQTDDGAPLSLYFVVDASAEMTRLLEVTTERPDGVWHDSACEGSAASDDAH